MLKKRTTALAAAILMLTSALSVNMVYAADSTDNLPSLAAEDYENYQSKLTYITEKQSCIEEPELIDYFSYVDDNILNVYAKPVPVLHDENGSRNSVYYVEFTSNDYASFTVDVPDLNSENVDSYLSELHNYLVEALGESENYTVSKGQASYPYTKISISLTFHTDDRKSNYLITKEAFDALREKYCVIFAMGYYDIRYFDDWHTDWSMLDKDLAELPETDIDALNTYLEENNFKVYFDKESSVLVYDDDITNKELIDANNAIEEQTGCRAICISTEIALFPQGAIIDFAAPYKISDEVYNDINNGETDIQVKMRLRWLNYPSIENIMEQKVEAYAETLEDEGYTQEEIEELSAAYGKEWFRKREISEYKNQCIKLAEALGADYSNFRYDYTSPYVYCTLTPEQIEAASGNEVVYEIFADSEIADSDTLYDLVIYGDANIDNNVDISDAVFILQGIADPSNYKYDLSGLGEFNADCYNSGNGVDAEDALAIQRHLADLEPLLSA